MNQCHFCKKPAPDGHNYCSWDCHVNEALFNGGKELRPNHLPIKCIKHDNTLLEHEHGDHPDYKFPVGTVYCGPKEDEPHFVDSEGKRCSDEEMNQSLLFEEHALIYCDGCVAVTMYECCYAMWYVSTGLNAGGSLWKPGYWRLSDLALSEIRKRWPREVQGTSEVPGPTPPSQDDQVP